MTGHRTPPEELDAAPPASSGRLFGLLGSQRWWVGATAALAFGTLGSGVGLVAMAAYLISRAETIDSTATLALAITGVRFFAVSRAALRYLERYVGHLATFRVLTGLRVWFFRGVEPLAPVGLQDIRRGDLLSRLLGDIDTLQDYALRVFVPIVAAVATTALVAILLGAFSPVLGVVALAYMVLVGFVLPWASRAVGSAASRSTSEASERLESDVVESVGGLAELVAWGREDRFTDSVSRWTAQQAVADRRLASVSGVAAGLGAAVVGLAAMALTGLVVPLARDGTVRPEYIAVMPLVALAALEAVQPLSAAMDHLARARRAGGRLDSLVASEPLVHEPEDPSPPPNVAPGAGIDLDLDDLRFSWPTPSGGQHQVFAGASLHLAAGSHTVLVGASGSGKSTLLSLLMRFVEPDGGSISLGGTDISTMAGHDVRRLVATVAQHDRLFDTTLRDNLLLADSDATDEEIEEALDAADAGFAVDLPDGLDFRVGEDGGRLSGGQRQRVMIARALLARAPVLVLDEATAHLDADSEERVVRGVRQWQGDRTLLTISHRPAATGPADRVLRLRDGRFSEVRSD